MAILGASIAACVAVLSLGAYFRFHLITEQGIKEGDTIGYYNIAKNWAKGDRTDFWGDNFYRPVVYELNALALKWFGDNDYAIKAMNGAFDVASLLLIILIARHLTGRMLPGIAAALVFALMPYAIQLCRSGMPHALSTFFVLLALYLFRPLWRGQSAGPARLFFDAGAGLSLGLAANTHAELGFLGFGFVACLGVQTLSRGVHLRAVGRFVLRAAVLTLAFSVPYVVGFALFGYDKVVYIFSHEIGLSVAPVYIKQAPLYRIPLDILTVSSRESFLNSWWIPLFVLLPPAAWCVRLLISGERKLPGAFTPWFLVVTYMLAFPVTVGAFDRTHVRIFLPLMPVVLIGAACAIVHLAGARTRFWPAALLTASTALVLYFAPNAAGRDDYFNNTRWHLKSMFRVTYDAAGKLVDSEHRMLILPSTALYNRGFQLDFYFGTNAEFLADQLPVAPYTPEFLYRIVTEGKFSYILLHPWIDTGFFDPNWPSTLRGRPWFINSTDVPYDADAESRLLKTFFARYGAHPIASVHDGAIYSLRKRPLFLNSAFGRGTLDNWRATGHAALFTPAPADKEQGPGAFHIDTRMKRSNPADPNSTVETAGTLESRAFQIEENVIGFVFGGVTDSEKTHVALLVAGTEMRANPQSPELKAEQWDVSAYRGQEARIVIRDLNPDRAKGISVAGFYYVF